MGTKEKTVKEEIVYVKGRLDSDLHKELKVIAKEDKMNRTGFVGESIF